MTTSELITPLHLARKALIYIRQSTLQQVLTNQESLRLQYALRLKALELGWQESTRSRSYKCWSVWSYVIPASTA